jgi:hypothetical protein
MSIIMALNNLLKYLLKENIDEAANTMGQAQSEGLALLQNKRYVILFSPNIFFKEMNEIFGEGNKEKNLLALVELLKKYKPLVSEFLPSRTKRVESFINSISLQIAQKSKISDAEITNIAILFHDLYLQRKGKTQKNERLSLSREQDNINNILDRVRIISENLIVEATEDSLYESVVGYIQRSPAPQCNAEGGPGTFQVDSSAAIKGWGPLIYDIAMSIVYPGYLIADRGSNSPDADKIWKYYLNNRPDVHKELLEELLTGDCDLPSSDDQSINYKLETAQQLIDRSRNEREAEDVDDTNIDDTARLKDVTTQIRKLLANIPQAWRYQISQPLNITGLEENLNQMRKDAKNKFNVILTDERLVRAGTSFFNVKYSLD